MALKLWEDSQKEYPINMAGVTSNLEVITKYIKDMTISEFHKLGDAIIVAFRLKCSNTTFPTHFIIPEFDYVRFGGNAFWDGTSKPKTGTLEELYFSKPSREKSKLQLLEERLRFLTQNPDFEIVSNPYCDQGNSSVTGIGANRYALMDLHQPCRPSETLYFDFSV